MNRHIATPLLGICLSLGLFGCPSKDAGPAGPTAPKQVSDASSDAAATEVGPSPDAGSADVDAPPTRPTVPLAPPLQPTPPFSADTLKDQAIGKISGPHFGQDTTVRGIARLQCADGTLLQPIFDAPNKKGALQVAPPVRVALFNLKTWEPVVYEDQGFEITSHFEVDTPERLKGRLNITYQAPTGPQPYLELEVDGPAINQHLPPHLVGKKDLPGYPKCVPTGYFSAKSGDQQVFGLMRADNAAGKGAPYVTLFLTANHALSFLVIPPKPETTFDEPVAIDLSTAREPGNGPAALLGQMTYFGRLKADPEATWKNVDSPREAALLNGVAQVQLLREKKRWHLVMTLNGITVPAGMIGLEGQVLDEIKIDAYLANETALESDLPAAPPWFGAHHE